jgi:hypothetical protein
MDKESRRNRFKSPVNPPPALVFHKTKFSLHNLIKIGVSKGLFTNEKADNNHKYAISTVKKFFESNIKRYLENGEYDSIAALTGEEPTEENIAKYKQLYL